MKNNFNVNDAESYSRNVIYFVTILQCTQVVDRHTTYTKRDEESEIERKREQRKERGREREKERKREGEKRAATF